MFASAPAAVAATIPVNITADTTSGGDGNCSLREAITSAEANANDNDCVDGDTAATDLIRLQAPGLGGSVYTLSSGSGEDDNASGDLDIFQAIGADSGLTIRGDPGLFGPGDTIDAGGNDRVLHIDHNGYSSGVRIETVAIKNGQAPAGDNGGGILASGTTVLTLFRTEVQNNKATSGGGIYKTGTGGVLDVFDSTIGGSAIPTPKGNEASSEGGGIYSAAPTGIARTTVQGNFATEASDATIDSFKGGGVALAATSGIPSILDSSIVGNGANGQQNGEHGLGGGLHVSGTAAVLITGSAIAGNGASALTTGVASGGGIYYEAGAAGSVVQNSTVSGNAASGSGSQSGGAVSAGGAITFIHTTVTLNTAGGLDGISGIAPILRGTIIDEGTEGCANAASANAYNVDAGTSCVGLDAPGDTDLESIPTPVLPALLSNGGPTANHALDAASPAVDAVPACVDRNDDPLLVDQRGAERPFGAACDAGAYERVICDGAVPTVLGGPGNDVLSGGSGPNVIVGSAGNDTIDAAEDNDSVCGGSGNDQITGGLGMDQLFGETGNDTMLAQDTEADGVDCGSGTDMFSVDSLLDTLTTCETDLDAMPAPGGSGPGATPAPPAAGKCPKGKKLKKVKRKRKCVKKKKKKK